MARTPAYWTNKKCRPSVQAVSQLSLSQAPHGFGAPYRGFPAFLSPSNCLKTAKLRRLCVFAFKLHRQATQAICKAVCNLVPPEQSLPLSTLRCTKVREALGTRLGCVCSQSPRAFLLTKRHVGFGNEIGAPCTDRLKVA